MATNSIGNVQTSGLYDFYKASLQAKPDQTKLQEQAKQNATKVEKLDAERTLEEQRQANLLKPATAPQTATPAETQLGNQIDLTA
jgi:hypothetical protein